MTGKLIRNDIKQNKLLSAMTIIFMAISSMLLVLTVLLFTNLLCSIDDLMATAKTPDFLQMHTGELDESQLHRFALAHSEVREWQICKYLNLENSSIYLGNYSLADSTQDNGLCVQGEKFDYLLSTENHVLNVSQGEVYVPVCYRTQYDLHLGDTMEIGSQKMHIAGFLRDSQMNSMMASSKRFLVNESDYQKLAESGEEEYLIEFLLKDGTDTGVFAADYAAEGLPANGPTITGPLIRMMNALSDGMMILVILLVSIVVLLISILCIRFILALRLERDKKEIGMLKALGIGKKEIRQLYFAKYILFSVCGAFIGLVLARTMQKPLLRQMQELYGASSAGWQSDIFSILAVLLTEGLILFSIRCGLKKTERYTVLEALFPKQTENKKNNLRQYLFIGFVVAACTFLMLVPQNLYSSLSSPKFVTYMGIGDGEIRIDIRKTEDIRTITERIDTELKNDSRVKKYTVLQTKSCPALSSDGNQINLTVEAGDHNAFPISYIEGKAPEGEKEIALSSLNAEELGLSVGSTLELLINDIQISYTICGIYSDITNGGKTAKVGISSPIKDDNIPAMWNIVYVSLEDSVSKEQWIEEYNQTGIKIVDIADYVKGTYGQTLQEIRLASKTATIIAAVIISLVVALFTRLIVEKNRYSISLQKALGFTSGSIKKSYMIKGLLPAIIGTVVGLITGNRIGEYLCGMILKSFGADRFHFVIDWNKTLFLIPIISLTTAGTAVWIGIMAIKKVKAFECCMGKE